MTVPVNKYMIAFAAAVLIAVAVSACGGGGGPPVNGPMPSDVDLSRVTPGFMAGAGTVTVEAGQSEVHGDIEFSCAAGGRDCEVMLTVDDDGILRAESTGGTVTAMNSDDYDRRVSIREAIAGIIEESSGGMSLGSSRESGSGSAHLQWSQTDEFIYSFGVPWRDNNGGLNFSMSLGGEELPDDSPIGYHGRSISGTPDDLVQDHGLGQNSQIDWHMFSTTNDYDGAGTLEVQFVTDVGASEDPGQTWVGYGEGAAGRTILLDDIPSLRAGHDWQGLTIGAGETLAGSLDGVAGDYSCYGGQDCGLEIEPGGANTGYYPSSGTVVFTPSDGSSPEMFSATASAPVAVVDYLAFGTWQYVPEYVEDTDSFQFGVFAGGGDPFDATNGAALTGTATYVGDAIGMYSSRVYSDYLDGTSLPSTRSAPIAQTSPAPFPIAGSFTADVTLTADFDMTALSGRVHGITYDNGGSHADIYLLETSIDHVGMFGATGAASDTASGGGYLNGLWSAAFFGNDPNDPTAHPTGVAGTFGVATADRFEGYGLVGAFGAHRQ